jgi:nucleotide-binding universal stress UspA family protein
MTSPTGYASIMVPMNIDADSLLRARLAANLADRFDSRLIGIAARPLAEPLYFETPVPEVATYMEIEVEEAARELEIAEKAFREASGTRNHVEWRQANDIPNAFVAEQARAADLIVASRLPKSDRPHRMALNPGQLVMDAGRPVLFVPPETDRLSARHVMIAWKDTREARRAVADAMPFLKMAVSVTVVTLGTDDRGAKDVVGHLAAHGIVSVAQHFKSAADEMAETLMRAADNELADLLVCGAYGHSRAREWIFGGVTRDLLANARMCCLMAH